MITEEAFKSRKTEIGNDYLEVLVKVKYPKRENSFSKIM